jgi:hypothetical protein
MSELRSQIMMTDAVYGKEEVDLGRNRSTPQKLQVKKAEVTLQREDKLADERVPSTLG